MAKLIDMQPDNVEELVVTAGEKALTRGKINSQYSDPRWLRVVRAVIKRDGYRCTRCPATKDLQVHHLKYIGEYVWSTPKKYLVTLCRTCHKKEHDIGTQV